MLTGASTVRLVLKGLKVNLVLKVQVVTWAVLVQMVHQELRECLATKDRPVHQVLTVQLVQTAPQVQEAKLEKKRENQDLQGHLVQKDRQDLLDLQARLERLAKKDQKDLADHLERVDKKVAQDPAVRKVPMENQGKSAVELVHQ